MPPAAPLPTTMTSHGPDFGVMDEAIRFDSETTPPRLRVRVGSGIYELSNARCTMHKERRFNAQATDTSQLHMRRVPVVRVCIVHRASCITDWLSNLLPTPFAVLPIDRLAAHELRQRLVALVAEFL